jgi:hypothetical protein
MDLLAVPQLAYDILDEPAHMNGGDSDTDLLLWERRHGRFEPFATVPAPAGEDAEFFRIGDRAFLAVASLRTATRPYDVTTGSVIHEWDGAAFVPFQTITTYAAKQWRHWSVGDRHFLGLAQGLALPHLEGPNRDSVVHEWDGTAFVEVQQIPSQWAYNWHPFTIDDAVFVAHADHVGPSVLYRWDGEQLVPHQELLARAGRSFAAFHHDGEHHLLVAGLEEPPRLLRWKGDRFEDVQRLEGLGARELAVVEHSGRLFVVRVNFILGTPADPRPVLRSQVYEWAAGELRVVAEFPTSGGTDVAVLSDGPEPQFVVSNSLTADIRFATDTVVYALSTSG